MNDKLRRAIKIGIIDEDYKDYLAVEKIPHDFSEKYEQRIGKLIKTNRKSGHRHIKITLRFAAAVIAAVLAVGSVTVAAVPPLREWFVGIFVTQGASHSSVRFADGDIEDNSLSVANNVMTPDFIPSGYVLSEDFIDDFTHIVTYTNGTEQIQFTQNDISAGMNIDIDDLGARQIKIGKYDGYISITENDIILVWTDKSFSYSIVGNASESDIIRMANSVKLHKLSK